MADGKTAPTEVLVVDFLAAVEPAARRDDAPVLDALFRKVTGVVPEMWGPTIVGYGEYNTVYESGRKVRCLRTGFSPRKARHSLYLLACGEDGSDRQYEDLLSRLGKYSLGQGGCLYVNKLSDIDLSVLEAMIELAWKNSFERYPA